MTSPPLDRTHGRQCQAWHDIIAFGLHTRSATSGVACYNRLWTAHTIGNVERGMTSPSLDSTHGRQRRACHDDITALGLHTWSNNFGRGMQSSPLGSTDSRTASGVACHHRPWTANMVEQRWAWHAIIALGQHTWSDDVGCGMTSLPLDNTHGRKRRACHDDITALGQNTWSATSSVA